MELILDGALGMKVKDSGYKLKMVRGEHLVDCSLPGSSLHGIFQTRVLEWVAIAFSPPNP